MRYLNKINENSLQRFFLTGNQGQRIEMTLRFLPTQRAWIMDIFYEDFLLKGVRVVNSPNLLRQFRNKIPFGFACLTKDGFDPFYIDDFANGRAALHLLSEQDIQDIEDKIYNGE